VEPIGITRTTLYTYIKGDGSVKEVGQQLLDAGQNNRARKTRKMVATSKD
jgi:hypothetical protein